VRKSILVVILFLFILFQSTATRLFPHLDNYLFLPNLPLILLAYICLYGGPERGIAVGFFLGFFEDSLSSDLMGLNSLVKTLLGFLLGVAATKFFIANKILHFLSVIILTLLNDICRELLKLILGSGSIGSIFELSHMIFLKTMPEAIINGLLAIVIFHLFEKIQLVRRKRNGD